MAAEVENLWRSDHEVVRQTMARYEADRTVSAEAWSEARRVELPVPSPCSVVLVDDEVLLGLLRGDGDDHPAEVGLRRDPVCERGGVPRLPADERQPKRVRPALDLESIGRERDVDVVRRPPDEGCPVQRRTQLPRQECRCVVCLRAAESGELGDGEQGGEKERGGDREENWRPAPGRGPAPGFRRAPTRPQVREARHVCLHPRADRTWLRY